MPRGGVTKKKNGFLSLCPYNPIARRIFFELQIGVGDLKIPVHVYLRRYDIIISRTFNRYDRSIMYDDTFESTSESIGSMLLSDCSRMNFQNEGSAAVSSQEHLVPAACSSDTN